MCVGRWVFLGQPSSPGSDRVEDRVSSLASSGVGEDSNYDGENQGICFEVVHEVEASRHISISGSPVAPVRP